jgi:hypothetical protein
MPKVRCSNPGSDAETVLELDDLGDGEPYSFTLGEKWTVSRGEGEDFFSVHCPRHPDDD